MQGELKLTGDEVRAIVKAAHNRSGPSDPTTGMDYVAATLEYLNRRAPDGQSFAMSIMHKNIDAQPDGQHEMKTITYDETKWKLVPVEPTERMKIAGNAALASWVAPAMHSNEAYAAMLDAAPTPQDGDAERERADAFVREFEEWVKQTGALPWGGSWMAEVSSIIERAASMGSDDGR